MSTSDRTLGQRGKLAIPHPHEREAVVLLESAGWTQAELAMTFEVSKSAINRLLQQERGDGS